MRVTRCIPIEIEIEIEVDLDPDGTISDVTPCISPDDLYRYVSKQAENSIVEDIEDILNDLATEAQLDYYESQELRAEMGVI
jgi:hypothetical protein